MSVQLIQQYHSKVERIIRYGGSRKETAVREPFKELLNHYARQRNLELIAELDYRTRHGRTPVIPMSLRGGISTDVVKGIPRSKDSAWNDKCAAPFCPYGVIALHMIMAISQMMMVLLRHSSIVTNDLQAWGHVVTAVTPPPAPPVEPPVEEPGA